MRIPGAFGGGFGSKASMRGRDKKRLVPRIAGALSW
jgi:hypothetical protein